MEKHLEIAAILIAHSCGSGVVNFACGWIPLVPKKPMAKLK